MGDTLIGRRLSHFEVTTRLGAGGMGEVYQSRDLKLNRDVAIKVLPAEFANDNERFERAARLRASLSKKVSKRKRGLSGLSPDMKRPV